ncbi:carboxypeptidase regulatory-like domain-containing protein [Archangium lansingense]|uniref:Carboxypeptidase regulatory-like domain-containing protein n=1 Tax=Archangium lansingense TaxID=2995310 RepID=A0ABT4AKJ1_9BACT|nr:carboxypeptidase regulatory-like domain-containing protein [Archangium lansinium]MCY1081679.1 carboxypeptidase regulatory-like domain-containing protein [Archangium lansinium]
MDRKRTLGLLVIVLVLVGGLLLVLRERGGEQEPQATRTGGTVDPKPAAAPAVTPPPPKPERESAQAAKAMPTRLVPATRAEDSTEPHGAFEGRVISATTGEGVEGAELTFAGPGGATSARSNASGRFRFVPSTAGTWQLAVVMARGYLPFGPEWGQSPIRFTAVPGQRISDLVLALTPEVELLGRVEGADGQPVAGAQVRMLTGRGEESVLFPTADRYTSDERGEFRFRAPEGAIVEARHPAHASARAEVTPSAVLSRRLVVKLGKREGTTAAPLGESLAGRVVTGGGTAVTGALVSVVSASAWPRRYGDELGYETVTDQEGRFKVEGLEPGSYDVTARLMGLAPGELRDVAAGRKDLVLTLAQGAKLVGTVRDATTGKPLPSFTLDVLTKRGPIQSEGFAQLSFIDAQGHYELAGVPPGSYRVQVAAHGYAPSETGVEVPKGTSGAVTANFSLARGAKLTGRVLEEGSGLPLERARIAIEGFGTGGALSVRYDALTDAQGQFTLDGLPVGEVTLYVSAEKHHSRLLSGVSVRPDATPPQVIELRKTEEGEEPQVELVGIGAVLAPREDALVLGEVMPGGGAAEAGLVTGDGIVRINGRPVVELGFTEAVQSIRGPEGSRLVLGVRKASAPGTGESPAPAVDITVTRRRIRR